MQERRDAAIMPAHRNVGGGGPAYHSFYQNRRIHGLDGIGYGISQMMQML